VKQSTTIWTQSAVARLARSLPTAANQAASAAVQRAEQLTSIRPKVYLVPAEFSAQGISVPFGGLQISDARTAATGMPSMHGITVASVPGPVPRGRPV
jgi:carbohydrate-binding DOMON domain-containing protein